MGVVGVLGMIDSVVSSDGWIKWDFQEKFYVVGQICGCFFKKNSFF